MPYIPLEMPLRVLTSGAAQKIEYYDGLEVDVSSPKGTYKYRYSNSERVCSFSPATSGPTLGLVAASGDGGDDRWSAMPFLPDLSTYTYAGEELVGGILCQKFTLSAHHGTLGTMDDHLAFYWDPVLGKPVRWRMHARDVTFNSHTDEYIMDFLSFQPGAPAEVQLALPAACGRPQVAQVSIQLHGLLAAAHAAASRSAAAAAAAGGLTTEHPEASVQHAVAERNVRLIRSLNAEHAGHTSFRENRFLGLTAQEVLQFRGGRNKSPSRDRRRPAELAHLVREHTLGAAQLPESHDWRVARPGSVGPVKDQGVCGSCWTYGLTEPIESIQAIRTGRLIELPEQFVVDCTWVNSSGSSAGNAGCDGGESDIGALEIVRKFGGIVPTAESYGSYLSVNGFCKDVRLMQVGAKITGWVDIAKRDDHALMEALFTVGPMFVGIQVPDEMLFYDSGVLQVESCRHNESDIDHAVTATGFGSDAHGTAFWTIRNSWSTYWGDKGYINIARGELDCCVSCQAGYPEIDAVAAAASIVI